MLAHQLTQTSILTLEHSEEYNATTTADWHISQQNMQNTFESFLNAIGAIENPKIIITRSNKNLALNNFAKFGDWVKNALINRLGMPNQYAMQLALLMERSTIRSFGYSEEDWQDYYAKRMHTGITDYSWKISSEQIQAIMHFIMQGIHINQDYYVPYFAGLSDDGKTIYFDRSLPLELKTDLGMLSLKHFIILHERVEGAMMEESYFFQLQNGLCKQIQFEYPIGPTASDPNYYKAFIIYQLVNSKLEFYYAYQQSSEEENKKITRIVDQAKQQKVLPYEFAHQIAERLERAAIFAANFGDVWEKQYNQPVQKYIETLAAEVTMAIQPGQSAIPGPPPDLYILPYMSYMEAEDKVLFQWLIQAKPQKEAHFTKVPSTEDMMNSQQDKLSALSLVKV